MDIQQVNKKMCEFFDERVEKFNYKDMTKIERMKQLFNGIVNEGDKVLDIACGVGTIDDVLIELGASEIFAIDLSTKMIAQAMENNSSSNIKYEVMDLSNLNVSGYDLAVVYNSYVHIVQRDVLIEKLKKSLKVGGRFAIINTANYKYINEQHSKGVEVDISKPIEKPSVEQLLFANDFIIDKVVDDENTYIISGIKK